MIQQSSANPAGIVINPKPATTPPDNPEGQWHGFDVIRLGRELVRSVNPFYVPDVPDNSRPPVPGVAAGIDLPTPDNQTSHCQGFTTLAARAIAAWANLPPEIDQALGYLANLLAAGQAAGDQYKALTAPAGVVPEPGTDWENAPDETVKNAKKKTGKAPQYRRRKPYKSATAMLRASQLPNTSLALGALVGFSAVGASSASGFIDWEFVETADKLKKICTDETKYPCDGKYWLTKDITIDASQWKPIGSWNRPFRGELNSADRTIRNLPDCLILNLGDSGKIQNLRFTHANIESDKEAAGVVACRMSENALVKNIHVKHANLVANSKDANASIVVGLVNGGIVFNIKARDCTVTATGAKAKAGIGAGLVKKRGTVEKIMAVNCNVLTEGKNANAGIGAGVNKGIVSNTTAYKCTVSTSGGFSDAGIGAGENEGIVEKTTAYKCTVLTGGRHSSAGNGAGYNSGTVRSTTAYKCTVLTNGRYSNAGIGAGLGGKKDASSNGFVINDTAAFGCNVSTTKTDSFAGIGAGYIEKYHGSIDKTTAIKCTVTTSGPQSKAGFGAGKTGDGDKTGPGNKRVIDNTRVIESTVKSAKESSKAAINGGPEPTVCNAKIINVTNTEYKTDNCHIDSNTACEGFHFRLARKNCQEVLDVLLRTNAPPTYPATEPLTTVSTLNISSPDSNITTTSPTTPAKSTNTTFYGQGSASSATLPTTPTPLSSSNLPLSSPGSASNATSSTTPAPLSSSKMPLSSTGSATSATSPITPAPLSSSKMPLSSTGSATSATSPITPAPLSHSNTISSGPGFARTTPAPTVTVMTAASSVSSQFATTPLTKSLSPAFIATIATLGTALIVLIGVIGTFTYRNNYRRPSANADRNQPMPEQPERRLRAERPLPAIPQPHLQALLLSRGNQAGNYPMANTGKENNLTMNQSLLSCESNSDDHHYDEIASPRGVVMATGGNNSIGNTGKETDQPNYQNETLPGDKFDHSEYELMVFNPADE